MTSPRCTADLTTLVFLHHLVNLPAYEPQASQLQVGPHGSSSVPEGHEKAVNERREGVRLRVLRKISELRTCILVATSPCRAQSWRVRFWREVTCGSAEVGFLSAS